MKSEALNDPDRVSIRPYDFGEIVRKYGPFGGSEPSAEAANDNNRYGPIDPWAQAKHPRLPEGVLPDVLEQFATVQGDVMGVDPGGLAAAALAVCGAAISDGIQIQVKAHDQEWRESARIWVALVGQPSAKKSPVIAKASAPLKDIDRELFMGFTDAKAAYDALPTEERKAATAPRNVRIRLEDTTIEGAQEVLKDSPNGVLCLQDELSGWFGSMEKYTSGRGSAKDRGFWLQAFNGGSYTVNRVGRGSVWIDNLSVSLLGGIQPDPIRRIAADMHDDGLLQRLFPVVMDESRVGKDEPTAPVVSEYAALIQRLHKLEKPRCGMLDTVLRFDDEAQALRGDLEGYHHRLVSEWQCVNGKIAAHYGKYDGLFARLCVIFHCIGCTGTRPAPLVSKATAYRAADFLHGYLLPHAIAFYSDIIGLAERHDAVLATAGYILANALDTITVREVRRGDRLMRTLENRDAEAVLQKLDAFGWLMPMPSLRSDSVRYEVVPSVHTLFADRAEIEGQRRESIRRTIRAAVAG